MWGMFEFITYVMMSECRWKKISPGKSLKDIHLPTEGLFTTTTTTT
jgi:hypothetical protein